jgi:hypothetical protein
MDLAVLRGRIGSASLAFGGPLNADVARRIACDAQVIPVVLGARGEPLDVGRASPPYPPRSAERSLFGTADAHFLGVPYQLAGAKFITLYMG